MLSGSGSSFLALEAGNDLLSHTSKLPADKYHALSDQTMDTLLDELETLLDSLGNPEYEVEYHVSWTLSPCDLLISDSQLFGRRAVF
jgi:Frataxin-like domain